MSRQPLSTPSPSASAQATTRLRLRGLALALGLTGASLVWLSLSSRMTAAGHEIAMLEAARGQLIEQRIAALLSHAAATDPRRVLARAEALGFQPVSVPVHLTVLDERALPAADSGRMVQALDITRQAGSSSDAVSRSPDLGGLLVEYGAAAPAHADELAGGGARP